MKQEKGQETQSREYYVSKEIVEDLINESGHVECVVHTKDSCDVSELTSVVEKTGSERGRHDLSVLYKTATVSGHKFQLSLDFVDYGASGYDYGEGKTFTQADRKKLLKQGNVLIYATSESKDKDTEFYVFEVLAEDTEVQRELGATEKVDVSAVISGLQDGTAIILPVGKETSTYAGIVWTKNSADIFKFHKEFMPKMYTDVAIILSDKVTVPKDFVMYDFFVMKKKVDTDVLDNTWVSLSFDCCLNTLDLLELDSTGKTHMYILDNFKDIDKKEIYKSFLKLPKAGVLLETMLRIIELVQPESTKWLEDYIVATIDSRPGYYFSDYIDIIVKYVRVAKKSKDKDVERFLAMMLSYGGYAHMAGYVRIVKALKLKDTELALYVERIIDEDKRLNLAGHYVRSFIGNWKTESFKVMEDYLYEGMQTQAICERAKDCNNKTEEEKQRRGLNSDYDFVKSYFDLLNVKGVDKVSLIERYINGVKEDVTHFPTVKLLYQVDYAIRYEKATELIPLFAQCVIDYDKYGEYAEKYLSKEKVKELGLYSWNTSYYTDDFEPYMEVFSKIVTEGKKKKSEDEWAERLKRQKADIAARLNK